MKKVKSIKPIMGGGLFLSFDFAALEVRAFVNIAREYELGKILSSGLDMHSSIAKKVFPEQLKDVPLEKIKSEYKQLRSYSKSATFSVLYGSSEFNLAEQIGIPVEQAKDIIDGLLAGFPGLRDYMHNCHIEAMTTGIKDTFFGYRRQLDEIVTKFGTNEEEAKKRAGAAGYGLRFKHALNASQNHEVQSTASIVGWIVASHIQDEMILQGLKSRVLGNVHDSVEMDIYPGELQDVMRICNYHAKVIPNTIYDWMDLVPLDFDFELGRSWGASGEVVKFEFDDENNKTYFKFVGGDLHWKYIEDQLKLAYDYKIIKYEEGKERSHDPKNPLDQPTKEVVVEVEIYNPVTVKEFKSKYHVGNGKLNTKIDN